MALWLPKETGRSDGATIFDGAIFYRQVAPLELTLPMLNQNALCLSALPEIFDE